MNKAVWPRAAVLAVLLVGGVLLASFLSGPSTDHRGSPVASSDEVAPTSPAVPSEQAALAPSPAPLPSAPVVGTAAPSDESSLMDRLRSLAKTDAAQCVELAREGNRLFPDSAEAPERTSLLIHALASLGRVSEARAEAETMVNDYADSPWVREIERFTGAHRHRNVRVTDDGAIEFY